MLFIILFLLYFWREEGSSKHKCLLSFFLWLQRCVCVEGGCKMFYACLNMHLKSKSIRNDTENAKGFHQRLLIHDALRKATYFRANSCYHRRSSLRRSHFPPEDMHFNDSLRCCCRNGYTQLHVCNTCNIKVERKTGVFPYITRVASSLYISPL